jgi:RNA polymerase sigma-70 factor (ECF subfamily)
MTGALGAALVAELVRTEGARLVAVLARETRDVELTEDCLQEAYAEALVRWPRDGAPEHPGAWVLTVARRRALDHVRRSGRRDALAALVAAEAETLEPASPSSPSERDERLALLAALCHPELPPRDRVALALRSLCGLRVEEVARALVVPPSEMRQRLAAASRRLRDMPEVFQPLASDAWPSRRASILATLYLVFNEGYAPTDAAEVRPGLCREAIRLATEVAELLPDDSEASGLLCLMRLHHARRDARWHPDGRPVRLAEQDRHRWHRDEIDGALEMLQAVLARRQPGPYQIQAAIAGLHAHAARVEDTDWSQIAGLYGLLLQTQPTPVVELNAAIAFGMSAGFDEGLSWLDDLAQRSKTLRRHHLLHAARADFLTRLGRPRDARDALEVAIAMAPSDGDRRELTLRRDALGGRARRRRRPLGAGPSSPPPLSDAAWDRIAHVFPPAVTRGRPPRPTRELFDAVLWVLVTGRPWRELPAHFGPWQTAYHRFRAWELDGTLARVLRRLAARSSTGRRARIAWHVAGPRPDDPEPTTGLRDSERKQ